MLHFADWDVLPGQFAPFAEGTGLSHRLVRVLRPSPHVLEHRPKLPQAPQPPLTTSDIKMYANIDYKLKCDINFNSNFQIFI